MTGEILTAKEAAAMLGVHVSTVRQLLAGKRLQGAKVGRAWRILRTAILSYLAPQDNPCRSTSLPIQTIGISPFRTKADDIARLLALPTGKQRKSITTNSKPNSGERKN